MSRVKLHFNTNRSPRCVWLFYYLMSSVIRFAPAKREFLSVDGYTGLGLGPRRRLIIPIKRVGLLAKIVYLSYTYIEAGNYNKTTTAKHAQITRPAQTMNP